MKTQSLVLAAAIATIMSAPTIATEWFVGGAYGVQEDKSTKNVQVESTKPEKPASSTTQYSYDKDRLYQLRGGAYLNDNNRVYGTYSYYSDYSSRQQSFLVSYDYLIGLNASKSLNWFVGATAGVNHFSPKTDELNAKNHFTWGGQTGLMYKITNNISTEIGYRYLKQEQNLSTNKNEPTYNLDNSQQVYLAVDYRF
ncbi:opacity protein [Shewanella psychrophila]|uniref:Opacity protein n=1 Tax=Shewanella psychrophila TaxID=225848 RepID=A0A1S6HS88_9GAMM|nr:outer membrane beta-barrel protein [Shewanella psychrophila]AQS38372.1 opacity protein [Shewanella psychrophila]